MSDYLQLVYFPERGTEPRATWEPNGNIACVYINDGPIEMRLQFKSRAMPDAVRYLRQLAAAATDLADQVQKHLEDEVAEAVLSS